MRAAASLIFLPGDLARPCFQVNEISNVRFMGRARLDLAGVGLIQLSLCNVKSNIEFYIGNFLFLIYVNEN